MGHSLFGFQHEPMAMKNSVGSWQLEAMRYCRTWDVGSRPGRNLLCK